MALHEQAAPINIKKQQSRWETIELRLSKVRPENLYFCKKSGCDHKECDGINSHVDYKEWVEWMDKHHFCTQCRRHN